MATTEQQAEAQAKVLRATVDKTLRFYTEAEVRKIVEAELNSRRS